MPISFPCKITLFLCLHSVGLSQRTNVISCVTVHDSDSSTASPLTPLPRTLNPASTMSSRQAKSLAVVAPAVKTQGSERGAVSRGRLETGESFIYHWIVFWVWKQCTIIILASFNSQWTTWSLRDHPTDSPAVQGRAWSVMDWYRASHTP